MNKQLQKGFTLIEILVVIGIIAILAAIVIIAINPQRQFQQANDSQRWSNVNAILNAVHQYAVDNRGQLPPAWNQGTTTDVCKSGATATSTCVDLSVLVPTYIVSMPVDPLNASDANLTGYKIATTTGGRVLVTAPKKEISTAPIQVER